MRLLSPMVLILLVFTTTSVHAEPIAITSGAWQWRGSAGTGDLTLAGEGFSFTGVTHALGFFSPYLQCHVPECHPGTTVDLRSHWIGLDVTGTATIDGATVRVGSLDLTFGTVNTEWEGSLTIPGSFSGGTLSAPFTFSGLFIHPRGPGVETHYPLFGGGVATLTFAPYQAYPGALQLTDVRYDFSDAAPTPEPASMLLIGTGLAGVLAARRRRRRQA